MEAETPKSTLRNLKGDGNQPLDTPGRQKLLTSCKTENKHRILESPLLGPHLCWSIRTIFSEKRREQCPVFVSQLAVAMTKSLREST
jgi:hypothetical protein